MKESATKKKDNGLNNLIINIVIPAVLLMKGAKWATKLGVEVSSVQVLIAALSLPLLYCFVRLRRNFGCVIHCVSTIAN